MPAVAVAWRLSVFPCSRYLVEGRQLGIGNVLHDRTPRLQEDQLALNAEGLKSCPLLDKSGQKWILAGDGLSAFVESPGGISPPGAPRSVREPIGSHGSRCSAVRTRG